MNSYNIGETDIDHEYAKQNAQPVVIDDRHSVRYNPHAEESDSNDDNDSPDVYQPTWRPLAQGFDKPNYAPNECAELSFSPDFEVVYVNNANPESACTEHKDRYQDSEWLDQEHFEIIEMPDIQPPVRVDTVADAEQSLSEAVADT